MKNLFRLTMLALMLVFAINTNAQTKITSTKNTSLYAMIEQNRKALTTDEQKMLNEINLVRTDPKGYIQHVDAFVADKMKSFDSKYQQADANLKKSMDEWKVAYMKVISDLKNQLNTMKPVQSLKFSPCILEVAEAHAIDQSKVCSNIWNPIDHTNSKGKGLERIGLHCQPSIPAGGENLQWEATWDSNPRKANVTLLIDFGIPNFGHRSTLLHRDFTHCAPYSYEVKGGAEDVTVWIQNYGTHKDYKPPVPASLPAGCPTYASSISWHSGLKVNGQTVSQDCFDWHRAKTSGNNSGSNASNTNTQTTTTPTTTTCVNNYTKQPANCNQGKLQAVVDGNGKYVKWKIDGKEVAKDCYCYWNMKYYNDCSDGCK